MSTVFKGKILAFTRISSPYNVLSCLQVKYKIWYFFESSCTNDFARNVLSSSRFANGSSKISGGRAPVYSVSARAIRTQKSRSSRRPKL